jgi:hypothetical protein
LLRVFKHRKSVEELFFIPLLVFSNLATAIEHQKANCGRVLFSTGCCSGSNRAFASRNPEEKSQQVKQNENVVLIKTDAACSENGGGN